MSNCVTMEHFARNMKACRLAFGWSQKELGERVGLDRTEILRIESGKRNISVETAQKIAEGLGYATWQLFLPDLKVRKFPKPHSVASL